MKDGNNKSVCFRNKNKISCDHCIKFNIVENLTILLSFQIAMDNMAQ